MAIHAPPLSALSASAMSQAPLRCGWLMALARAERPGRAVGSLFVGSGTGAGMQPATLGCIPSPMPAQRVTMRRVGGSLRSPLSMRRGRRGRAFASGAPSNVQRARARVPPAPRLALRALVPPCPSLRPSHRTLNVHPCRAFLGGAARLRPGSVGAWLARRPWVGCVWSSQPG